MYFYEYYLQTYNVLCTYVDMKYTFDLKFNRSGTFLIHCSCVHLMSRIPALVENMVVIVIILLFLVANQVKY